MNDYGSLNDIYNNTQKPKAVDTAKLAQSPYGDLELTKYLYENGLQNVFSDYQKNMSAISQQKQQSLQDAYYIKEMSKKYLGEYASNTGLGDVSGNLLDIYSSYNKNVNDAQKNYDTQALGLESAYQATKQGVFENLLKTQYQIDVAKLQESEKDIAYNLTTGNTGGLDSTAYLYKALTEGKISKATYQALSKNTSLQLKDIMSPKVNGADNPNYIGDDYDFKLMLPGENVDRTSTGYMDAMGNKYFSVKDSADNDSNFSKSTEDLFSEWKKGVEDGTYDHKVPVNGDVVQTTAYDNKAKDYKNTQYIYLNNTWHRLTQEQTTTPAEMSTWRLPENANKAEKNVEVNGANYALSNEWDRRKIDVWWKKGYTDYSNSITVNGVKYHVNDSESFDPNSKDLTEEQRGVVDLFRQAHKKDDNGGIYNLSFVFYKGKFYGYQDGKIHPTVKEK